ncbi:MAG: hypothetical protein ACLPHE_10330 [Methanobacterium sp.]
MVKETKDLTSIIYDNISSIFNPNNIYMKGKDGVSNIVLFDEPVLIDGEKSRYRILYSSMMVFEDDKLRLAIEILPNKPTPPRDIAGPIPVYMVTRKVVINRRNGKKTEYELTDKNSKFNLLIVIPDQFEGSQKSQKSLQIKDLNEKFKGVIDLESEYSNLKDFAICEISDLDSVLERLLKN